ncbi:PTS sugar transporter subunit IIC [Vulgatibacter incomptus]|uniref:PTS system, mannose-specific IIC component n=1 Tax=Vulgatibacter incomptus TaxID=1391653 RepID=A0A0K1PFP0_9BACT|nr:PTS sugar transporter subunit IIC [Vulgatibacter incomptus]AKU92226.1 PTS system, mannose-specific IIC component [Vulgatibacter incomptus]
MSGPLPIIAAAVVGGLVSLDRKAFLQAQASRPIVVGPLLGWILGDAQAGLMIGAPLELLWIGAANLGASLPQHETAASLAIVAAGVSAGSAGFDASIACLAFALFAPVAIVARRLERLDERSNEKAQARAERWLEEGRPDRAVEEHLKGLWRPFVGAAVLAAVAAAAGGPLVALIHRSLPLWLDEGLGYGWLLLWAVGGAASVRVARIPGGLWMAGLGATCAVVVALAMSGRHP